MPAWTPEPIWKGEDAYIIGGGDSLRSFDWDLIRGKNTIGCNSTALVLGAHICKILLFSDELWWEKIGRQGSEQFGGLVVGCSPRLHSDKTPWLLTMPRGESACLGRDRLAWACNTGGAAVNLALILGALRVYLLGFDMKLSPAGRANWHDLRHEAPEAGVYPRFISEMRALAQTVEAVFPGAEVFNVTDDSELPWFPKVSLAEHFRLTEAGQGR